jgi:hypothetical protein
VKERRSAAHSHIKVRYQKDGGRRDSGDKNVDGREKTLDKSYTGFEWITGDRNCTTAARSGGRYNWLQNSQRSGASPITCLKQKRKMSSRMET